MGGYKEDGGFAINGGKGWKDVVFTCATTGDEAKVEYTFGYKRCADGKARIFLHHSSVPYSAAPAAAAAAPVTADEVKACQAKWANAITTISKTYADKANVDGGYKEDGGFAINGGKGWKNVVFTNHQIECHNDVALAMGSYVFTCATTGDQAKV